MSVSNGSQQQKSCVWWERPYSSDDTMCGPCADIKCSLPATLLHTVVPTLQCICLEVMEASSKLSTINSLGPRFSSQGHFDSLQLLNVPQFLFSQLVRLKTAPRGNFSHAQLIRDSDHTHQLANAQLSLTRNANLPQLKNGP